MKLLSVRIQKFRAFEDETIKFDDYTCLVGPNGSGKSTVLYALNIFFRETAESPTNLIELQEEDFHGSGTSEPIEITVTFTDLNKEAQRDFADYYRQGQLVVTAKAAYDPETQKATVRQYGERKGVAEFRGFFEAEKRGATVPELKEIYSDLQKARTDLPNAANKSKMIESLRTYEENHPDLAQPIPSEDQFYGFSRGRNRLAKYLQWVFVPAVKDASTEQLEAKDTALGKLLARTVRAKVNFDEPLQALREKTQEEYEKLLAERQGELDNISRALKQRLEEWAHPDASLTLRWHQDPEKSVRVDEPLAQIIAGEGAFSGNIARFGHGFQRSYLLALLQELSGSTNDGEPRLILGCEEPELYQHPPQCRHMAQVLQTLSTKDAQVIISTHSPYFVSGKRFENVRMFRKEPQTSRAKVSHVTYDEIGRIIAEARENEPPKIPEGTLLKIHQALQPALNEIFFTNRLVLVEGREDIAYITTYLTLMGHDNDVRKAGCHFVATDKKSHMVIPLAIAKQMGIPTFVVFDADGHLGDHHSIKEMHRKDNLAVLRLAGVEGPDPFPKDTFWGPNMVMWNSELSKVVEADFDQEEWNSYQEEVRAKYGHVGYLHKNSLFVADVLEAAWRANRRSPILERLCRAILAFCGVPEES